MRSSSSAVIRERISDAQGICESEVWLLEDLKELSDPSSALYTRAMQRGVALGIAKNIRKDIREFKQIYRARIDERQAQEEARLNTARELANLRHTSH